MTTDLVDLGDGHALRWVAWAPDRRLNPQYTAVPDIDPCGAIVEHPTPSGEPCAGFVAFDLPGVAEALPDKARWTVVSLDPLTLFPSVECRKCRDHGYIRNGRWVRA